MNEDEKYSVVWKQRMSRPSNVPDEIKFLLYRDVGQFLTKNQQTDLANEWYSKALSINPDSAECYYSRSVNSANAGHGKKSLEDAEIALKLQPYSTSINLQEASAYIHCNRFEEAIVSLHNNSKKFNSKKMRAFVQEVNALQGIYNNSLGFELVHFAYSKRKLFNKIGDQIQAENKLIEEKEFSSNNECDVENIKDVTEKFIHPRENERRKLAYRNFHQIYAGRSWIDSIFLNKLRNDKTLLLSQTPHSTQQIRNTLNENFNISTLFFKMLHAQDPLYHMRFKTSSNPKFSEQRRQNHLYRVQYQTRREMFSILNRVKLLRHTGRLKGLIDYVERVMCIYPAVKIKRVMPWKYEFVYEILNTVGLAYCDEFLAPPSEDLIKLNLHKKIMKLLKVEKPKEKQSVNYVFGDKTTYQEPDAKDYNFIRYKNHIKKLENWLQIVKYPIENIFVLYQIGRTHLKQGKYEDCLLFMMRCKALCEKHQNNLWNFLSNLMILRAYALEESTEQNFVQIEHTLKCAQPLNNSQINTILSTIDVLNTKLKRKKGIQARKNGTKPERKNYIKIKKKKI